MTLTTSLPSSAEVKNEKKLYILSPVAPACHAAGQLYFTLQIKTCMMVGFWVVMPWNLLCVYKYGGEMHGLILQPED
jgi:hypothetical protein